MSTEFIFVAGIICFALTMVGAALTVYEFKKIARANVKPSASVAALPVAVQLACLPTRAA